VSHENKGGNSGGAGGGGFDARRDLSAGPSAGEAGPSGQGVGGNPFEVAHRSASEFGEAGAGVDASEQVSADDDSGAEPVLGLPPSPLCERCAHQLCPFCPAPSCDSFDGDDFCCDGDCVVDAYDFAAWQVECDLLQPFDFDGMVTVQEGPFLPDAIRRRRADLP
jgi:hypothetical protein